MQPLDLNLASRPFKNDTLPWLGAIVVGALLVGVTIWNVDAYRKHSLWVTSLEQQFAERQRELEVLDQREREAQREISQVDRETLEVRADKANEVIRWKGFSWTRLFNHMEEVMPNDVQMTSIRPLFRPESAEEQRDRRKLELHGRVPVSVEGTAKTRQALFEFERNLFSHRHFDQVEPERTDTESTGSTLFSLRFLYDPSELPGDVEPGAEAADVATAGDAEGGTAPASGDAMPAETGVIEGGDTAAAVVPPPAEPVAGGVVATDPAATPAASGAVNAPPPPPAEQQPTVRSFGEQPGAQPEETEAAPAVPEAPRRNRRGGPRRGKEGGN